MNNHYLKPSGLFQILLLLGLAVPGVMSAQTKAATQNQPRWEILASGITEGISGLARVEHDSKKTVLLAVYDNKKADQKRLGLITHNAGASTESTTIAWPGDQPADDLEAICRLPGGDRAFLALTGKGALLRLALEQDNKTVRVGPVKKVPEGGREYEALDVQRVAGKIIACWAERGDGAGDGVLHFAIFDPLTLEFSDPKSEKIRAPWPTAAQRHISDLRLLSDGTVLATSASDPGDDGPFSGALYAAGIITMENDRPRFVANDQTARLFVTHEHKIEALEFIPGPNGGMVLGSDDENKGGAIYFGW